MELKDVKNIDELIKQAREGDLINFSDEIRTMVGQGAVIKLHFNNRLYVVIRTDNEGIELASQAGERIFLKNEILDEYSDQFEVEIDYKGTLQ